MPGRFAGQKFNLLNPFTYGNMGKAIDDTRSGTEGVELEFTKDAIDTIAEIACQINEESENIGARRLHTVMEQLLEEVSFTAPELKGQKISITPEYIKSRISNLLKNQDLSRYIL